MGGGAEGWHGDGAAGAELCAAPDALCLQPPGGAVPQPGHAVCPSSALPGDTYNSTAGGSPATSSDSGEGPSVSVGPGGGPGLCMAAPGAEPPLTTPPHLQFTAAPRTGKGPMVGSASPGEAPPAPTQGPVLQFFTRLRRHASLDGASPYFRIKKWKLESTQRASSLDTRGGGRGGWGGGCAPLQGCDCSPPPTPAPPQGPPSAASSSGSVRPARAWTRRTATPTRPTSSNTSPTPTTSPSTPRAAPSCPPPAAPLPLSAGIFQ